LKASARFEVGSITKTFVAALTLLLVEDGELGLDDEVTTQLSARYEPIGSVTLRSLLNHTSGIPDFFEDAGFAARWKENPNRAWDPDELLEVSLALPPHEPGVFSYANCNYVLIGLVIESVTGFSLAKLLRRRILDPIGLSATQLPEPATVAARSCRRPTTLSASSRRCSPGRSSSNRRCARCSRRFLATGRSHRDTGWASNRSSR
jgi:D-alanyl-D-alanine carboxypeptidase